MRIVEFNISHIESAMEIAKAEYEQECTHVPILPEVEKLPELIHFADNELGVAALDGEKFIGFLGTYAPTDDHFHTTNIRGTFSPVHAHGVITEQFARKTGNNGSYNRDRIYSLLYQEAARKWVKAGIRSHAIGLYTHDQEAIKSFYYNGFGLRCIDAIRSLEDTLTLEITDRLLRNEIVYCEVPRELWGYLLEHNNALISHLGESPTFMKFDLMDEKEFYRRNSSDIRYFAAKEGDRYIAYIKLSNTGENFATEVSSMRNICGAYCNMEYRGTGVYHNLLQFMISTLNKEGFLQLGVDCESFNPTARGFWLKHFTEYTHSLVRRIDDKAILD